MTLCFLKEAAGKPFTHGESLFMALISVNLRALWHACCMEIVRKIKQQDIFANREILFLISLLRLSWQQHLGQLNYQETEVYHVVNLLSAIFDEQRIKGFRKKMWMKHRYQAWNLQLIGWLSSNRFVSLLLQLTRLKMKCLQLQTEPLHQVTNSALLFHPI